MRARHKVAACEATHARLEGVIWGEDCADVIRRDVAFACDLLHPTLGHLMAYTVRALACLWLCGWGSVLRGLCQLDAAACGSSERHVECPPRASDGSFVQAVIIREGR